MDEIQKKLFECEQEILDVIDDVCRKNNLRYSLAYGTLLGAVRHKGFIPWDDDIDIMMPRSDYDKLLKIWNDAAPKGYILQTYYDHPDYDNNFSKIRKDNTTFIMFDVEKTRSYHKGIFVDIFPAEYKAEGKIGRKIQFAACALNLLYTRGYTSGAKGMQGKLEKMLLNTSIETRHKRKLQAEKIILKWKNKPSKYLLPCTIDSCRLAYPAEMFDNLIEMEFNGKKYLATGCYDEFLKLRYGDYMQLPPEEDRVWKHHPILIDFEHNYGE